jgi:hypothetical protein
VLFPIHSFKPFRGHLNYTINLSLSDAFMLLNSPMTLTSRVAPAVIKLTRPACYALNWRQHQLIVRPLPQSQATFLPSVDNRGWLVDCLRRSASTLVKLDLGLGEIQLITWANACQQADKAAYLSLPSTQKAPSKKSPLRWWLKRSRPDLL